MNINLDELVAWMGDDCGLCEKVGDAKWIDVHCELAQRIVWGGEPYNEADTAFILSHVRRGHVPRL